MLLSQAHNWFLYKQTQPLAKACTHSGSAITYPLPSAQSSWGASLKQVVPRSSQTLLVPAGGLWSLRKRARLRADVVSGCAPRHSSGSRQPTPKPTQQVSPAGAIAMEKGRLGAVEQVELGFLGLDLVLTLVQVAKASTDSVGTSMFWVILEA